MITVLLLVRADIYSFVLRAHPVRGKSHIQRNATGEVATYTCSFKFHAVCFWIRGQPTLQ